MAWHEACLVAYFVRSGRSFRAMIPRVKLNRRVYAYDIEACRASNGNRAIPGNPQRPGSQGPGRSVAEAFPSSDSRRVALKDAPRPAKHMSASRISARDRHSAPSSYFRNVRAAFTASSPVHRPTHPSTTHRNCNLHCSICHLQHTLLRCSGMHHLLVVFKSLTSMEFCSELSRIHSAASSAGIFSASAFLAASCSAFGPDTLAGVSRDLLGADGPP